LKKVILAFLSLTMTASFSFAEICGKTDDRVLSIDPHVGRLAKEGEHKGCAATLISDKCVITIGTCAQDRDYVEFNVPTSIEGVSQASKAEDVYYVKKGTAVFDNRAIGDQWAVMQLEPNRTTNKLPGDVQGFYKVATQRAPVNEPIRVVQFSYALNNAEYIRSGEVLPTADGEIRHFAQQVSRGKLIKSGIFLLPEIVEHNADTSYASGGAPIISERTNEVVGINTHGGCAAQYYVKAGARYTNSGTSVTGSRGFRNAIAACLAR